MSPMAEPSDAGLVPFKPDSCMLAILPLVSKLTAPHLPQVPESPGPKRPPRLLPARAVGEEKGLHSGVTTSGLIPFLP